MVAIAAIELDPPLVGRLHALGVQVRRVRKLERSRLLHRPRIHAHALYAARRGRYGEAERRMVAREVARVGELRLRRMGADVAMAVAAEAVVVAMRRLDALVVAVATRAPLPFEEPRRLQLGAGMLADPGMALEARAVAHVAKG